MLGLWELTDGVLTQTALDVCVGMAQLTAIWAFQGNLSDTGPLLLAARTPVIQILGLGRVPGDKKGRMSANLPENSIRVLPSLGLVLELLHPSTSHL